MTPPEVRLGGGLAGLAPSSPLLPPQCHRQVLPGTSWPSGLSAPVCGPLPPPLAAVHNDDPSQRSIPAAACDHGAEGCLNPIPMHSGMAFNETAVYKTLLW